MFAFDPKNSKSALEKRRYCLYIRDMLIIQNENRGHNMPQIESKQQKRFLGIVLSLGIASQAFGIGGSFIGNEVPSARAAGQGYVGVAGQNNDPTAVYSNPGAMTSLKGTQATFGLHWENIHGGDEENAGGEAKEKGDNIGGAHLPV